MSGPVGAGPAEGRFGGVRENQERLQGRLSIHHLSISPLADRKRILDREAGLVACRLFCKSWDGVHSRKGFLIGGGTGYGLGNGESTQKADST